jgi:hypothetical protein
MFEPAEAEVELDQIPRRDAVCGGQTSEVTPDALDACRPDSNGLEIVEASTLEDLGRGHVPADPGKSASCHQRA